MFIAIQMCPSFENWLIIHTYINHDFTKNKTLQGLHHGNHGFATLTKLNHGICGKTGHTNGYQFAQKHGYNTFNKTMVNFHILYKKIVHVQFTHFRK